MVVARVGGVAGTTPPLALRVVARRRGGGARCEGAYDERPFGERLPLAGAGAPPYAVHMAARGTNPALIPPGRPRRRLLARAVTALSLGFGARPGLFVTARAQGVPAASSLLATIGDDPIVPSLRAAAPLDLGANPIAVPGGWFVPLAGPGSGHAVLDEAGGAPMASAVASLGGLEALGPPVTRPFLTADGWIAQVMARAVVACEPPGAGGRPRAGSSGIVAATPTLLGQAGLDDLLGAAGVPPGAPPAEGADAWHRLGWITDRSIRAAYLAPVAAFRVPAPRDEGGPELPVPTPVPPLPDLATLAGPPTSLVVTTGAWRRQRFERAIVEVAVPDRDGLAEDPSPTIVPVGLLLRRATSLPVEATMPDTLVGGAVVVRGPMATVGWRINPTPRSLPRDEGVGEGVATPTPRPPDTTIRGPAPAASPSPPGVTTAPHTPTPPSSGRVPGAAVRVRSITATGGSERVTLANDGAAPQDVGGWALRAGTSSTAYRIPAGLRLDPGATLSLLSGRDAPAVAPAGSVTLARRSLWRDDGGTLVLVDRDGEEVDRRAWP